MSEYGFGEIDPHALSRIETTFRNLDSLVTDTEYDSPLNPTELRVFLGAGFDSEEGRFDVRWGETGMYAFHYTEFSGLDFRFDRHPNPHSSEKHFHPPPEASRDQAERSCIEVESSELVARAVHRCFRTALDHSDLTQLNLLTDPP
jgi:hypothetical protein